MILNVLLCANRVSFN